MTRLLPGSFAEPLPPTSAPNSAAAAVGGAFLRAGAAPDIVQMSPSGQHPASAWMGTVSVQHVDKHRNPHGLIATERVDSAHKVAQVLKSCRHSWMSAREVSGLVGSREDTVMRWLCALHECGLLETKHEKQPGGKPGRYPRVYRVAPEWRNGG